MEAEDEAGLCQLLSIGVTALVEDLELKEGPGNGNDLCDVIQLCLGGGRSPSRLRGVDGGRGRDGDGADAIREFPP